MKEKDLQKAVEIVNNRELYKNRLDMLKSDKISTIELAYSEDVFSNVSYLTDKDLLEIQRLMIDMLATKIENFDNQLYDLGVDA